MFNPASLEVLAKQFERNELRLNTAQNIFFFLFTLGNETRPKFLEGLKHWFRAEGSRCFPTWQELVPRMGDYLLQEFPLQMIDDDQRELMLGYLVEAQIGAEKWSKEFSQFGELPTIIFLYAHVYARQSSKK